MADYTNLTLGGGNYGMGDQDWAKYVKGLNGMPPATGGLNALSQPNNYSTGLQTMPFQLPQGMGFTPTAPSVVDRTKPFLLNGQWTGGMEPMPEHLKPRRPKEIGGMEPMPVQTGGMEPSQAGIPGFDYRNFNSGTTVGNPTSPVVLPERKLPPMNAGPIAGPNPLQPPAPTPNGYTGSTVDWSPVALSQKLSDARRSANAGQANFNAPAPQAPMQLNNGFMSGGQNGDTRSNAGGFYGTPGYFQARGEPWRIK